MKTLLLPLCLTACINNPNATPDPELLPIDQQVVDLALPDALLLDAGLLDAGLLDAGLLDASLLDAGLLDAGLLDAGAQADENWQIVTDLELPGTPRDLDWLNNRVYATVSPLGIALIRVAQPRQPRFTAFVSVQGAQALAISPHHPWGVVAAVGDGVRVLDFSDPDAPEEMGAFDLVGAAGAEYAQDIVLDGELAYVAAGSQGVWQVDITDPARPRGTASCCGSDAHPLSGPRGIEWVQDRVWVADTVEGLSVLALRNDESLREVSRTALPGQAQAIRRIGQRAFVLLDDDTVAELAPRAPDVLEVETLHAVPAPATHLTVAGNRLLIGTGDGVWHIRNGRAEPLLSLGGRPATAILVNGEWMFIGSENRFIIAHRGD